MGVKSSAQTHAAAGQSAPSSLHAGLPCGHKQARVQARARTHICLGSRTNLPKRVGHDCPSTKMIGRGRSSGCAILGAKAGLLRPRTPRPLLRFLNNIASKWRELLSPVVACPV